jgi:hypothetical protein
MKTTPLTTELRNEQSLIILTQKIEELKDIVIGQKEEITHLKNDVMVTLSRIESYHLGGNYRGGNFNSNKPNNAMKLENEIVLTDMLKNKNKNKVISLKKKKSNNNTERSFKTNKTEIQSQINSLRNDTIKSLERQEMSFPKNNFEQISKIPPPKKHERPDLSKKFDKVMNSNFY